MEELLVVIGCAIQSTVLFELPLDSVLETGG